MEDKEAHGFYNLCVPEIALLTSTLVLLELLYFSALFRAIQDFLGY